MEKYVDGFIDGLIEKAKEETEDLFSKIDDLLDKVTEEDEKK